MAKVQHTVKGCVPIDRTIIEVYLGLVTLYFSGDDAEKERMRAELERIRNESERIDAEKARQDSEGKREQLMEELQEKVDALALGKFYGFFLSESELPVGDEDGFAFVGEETRFEVFVFIDGEWSNSGTVYAPPFGNGEDIDVNEQGEYQFANRPNTDGLGYVILRKGKNLIEQMTLANTIYEIRYDFDLGGASISIPEGSILSFIGGKFAGNGRINGNKTIIKSVSLR